VYRSQATPERQLSVEPDVQISNREGQELAGFHRLLVSPAIGIHGARNGRCLPVTGRLANNYLIIH
jgi:hypothetical protein